MTNKNDYQLILAEILNLEIDYSQNILIIIKELRINKAADRKENKLKLAKPQDLLHLLKETIRIKSRKV